MDIIGTGLDATEIDRIAETIERYGDRFVRRVFTDGEIAYCRRKRDFASSFAARFAAKEAAMKALGTGWRGVAFREIAVRRGSGGKPHLEFSGRALARARSLGVRETEISITHTADLAAAVVVLVTGPDPASG